MFNMIIHIHESNKICTVTLKIQYNNIQHEVLNIFIYICSFINNAVSLLRSNTASAQMGAGT